MVVLEVRQQLEHPVALLLKVVLDLPEGLFKCLVLHVVLLNCFQEFAQFSAH